MKQRISIKPLSVNACWQGKRFKTPTYKAYEKEALLKLKAARVPDGKLHLILTIGLSSKLADIDNICKPFIDIMQKRFKFNDRFIYKLTVKKIDVAKGSEFIEFELLALIENNLN